MYLIKDYYAEYIKISYISTTKTSTWFKNEQMTWADGSKNKNKTKHQLSNNHMKWCSTSLVITKLQIKSTMSYYLTLICITTFKIIKNNYGWGCEKMETSLLVRM